MSESAGTTSPARIVRIVIIGGGLAGLTAAHRLRTQFEKAGRPLELEILEASDRAGGVLDTAFDHGCVMERGPDSIITDKPWALALCEELGLGDEILPTNSAHRGSFLVRKGRLVRTPEGFHLMAPSRLWPFAFSSVVSPLGKIRMAMDLVLPRGSSDDETLGDFVRRRLGREALERIAQPMVGGIYTADPDKLSLLATMPRFKEMEATHRSLIVAMMRARRRSEQAVGTANGPRYDLFVTMRNGMAQLATRLVEAVGAERITLKTAVSAVTQTSNGWQVTSADGKVRDADTVIVTTPSYVTADLLRGLSDSLARELAGIEYSSAATVNLLYRREDIDHPLDAFGFVVPAVERFNVLACTFSSRKFAGRAPDGFMLLRAFIGGALAPEQMDRDDGSMIDAAVGDLARLLGAKKPQQALVTRWPRSMPQYHFGHLDRIARIDATLSTFPGLVLAGNAYRGIGIPDTIRVARKAADQAAQPWLDALAST
ncbi:MAG: oxygen-dependent protoporphyrinogen oxidase [Candidatus Binatia bacterium]